MKILHIRPSHLSDVDTLPWEIQTSLFALAQKKMSSNRCLVLPITCIVLILRLGHATGGVQVLIWTC